MFNDRDWIPVLVCILLAPLGVWKLIDGIVWLCRHVHIY